MMSRYAEGTDYNITYSPSSSPRGRRYILKNLNTKKLHLNHLDTSRKIHADYDDIQRAAPSSVGSISTNHTNRSNKPIGTNNKVMPTESIKRPSPRKTPRDTPVFVSPRKDLNAKNMPQKIDSHKQNDNKSPRKGDKADAKNSPRKGDTADAKNNVSVASKKNENGLTPRDEYMVTKLYDPSIIYLKPSEVRYTHDHITAHFQDGRSIISAFIALLYARVEIRLGGSDVPPIEVMQTSDIEARQTGRLWYVVNGNRRLYVLRRLERCGALESMQVIARKYDSLEMDKHFLTRNHGRTISITNDATLNAKFAKEVKRWKEWKVNQPKQKPKQGQKGQASKSGAPDNSKCEKQH